MNKKVIVYGVLAGSVISAAAVLLNTQTSGKGNGQGSAKKETLMDSFKVLKTEGGQLKTQVTLAAKEGSTLVTDLIAEVKASIESWKNTIEPHQKNIQQHLSQIEESLKELEEKNSSQKSNSDSN